MVRRIQFENQDKKKDTLSASPNVSSPNKRREL